MKNKGKATLAVVIAICMTAGILVFALDKVAVLCIKSATISVEEIIPNLTYRLLDFDDNKLMDYLAVSGEVSSLKTGNYTILGELFDVNGNYITSGDLRDPSKGKVSFISQSKYFDEGNKGFEMFFRGRDIYESGSSGPYSIEIIINNDGMVCAEGNIVTKELKLIYRNSFTQPSGILLMKATAFSSNFIKNIFLCLSKLIPRYQQKSYLKLRLC